MNSGITGAMNGIKLILTDTIIDDKIIASIITLIDHHYNPGSLF